MPVAILDHQPLGAYLAAGGNPIDHPFWPSAREVLRDRLSARAVAVTFTRGLVDSYNLVEQVLPLCDLTPVEAQARRDGHSAVRWSLEVLTDDEVAAQLFAALGDGTDA